MHINIAALPPAENIEHPAIAAAAAAYAAAQQALNEKQRELVRHQDGREAALEQDAIEAEQKLAAGGPMPKRKHAAAWDAKSEDLDHGVRVAKLAVQRAQRDLQAVLDEHAGDWADDLDQHAAALDQTWNAAVRALQTLHAERSRAHQRRRTVGGEVPAIGSIRLKPGSVFDSLSGDRIVVEVVNPSARSRQRFVASVEDVLAALHALGEPEPDAPMPGSDLADLLKLSFDHARAVERGFSDEEIENNSAPAINTSGTYINGMPVAVYTGRDDDE